MDERKQVQMRATEEDQAILQALTAGLGLSASAVLRLGMRRLAKEMGIEVPEEQGGQRENGVGED